MPQYFISRERKNEIKDAVLDILRQSGVTSLPVNLNKIVKHYGIRCIGADRIAARSSKQAAGDDGYIIESGGSYVIVYNPRHVRGRVRFTIACQLAHIFLGHLGLEASRATDLETAYFADELLMPLAVLDSLGCRSAERIAERCDVSLAAANIRLRDFARRDRYKKFNGETEYDLAFLRQFLFPPQSPATDNPK